ncbi:SufI protein [Escherichia coli]|uniref:SufI protein n=1 Tax=Escherichia coli TaxID=562 RepID=A0A376MID3_ECOLX|nr:SufI protein [Escherichia coli]
MFQIRNVNGAMPFPEDRGWKDTVWVDGQVELLVYFGQPSWAALPVLLQQSDAGNGGPWLDRATVGQSGTVIFILARGGRVWNTFRFLFRSGL